MSGFTKLSSDIVTSTIWLEDDSTLRIWIGLLALAGPDGFVPGSVPGLANVFRVTVPKMLDALATFKAPDPFSRTKDNEGRRIEEVDGGWVLLNHAKHREKKDPEIRRKQIREAVARHRAKQDQCNQTVNNVINVSQSKPKSEVRSQITEAFKTFWSFYPKKKKKTEAFKVWEKLSPDAALFGLIIEAVKVQAASPDWKKEGGKFIPHPTSWLNGKRWEDEPDKPAQFASQTTEELERSKKSGTFSVDY